jgi:tetratricopeptide (TPR) repeat protein
VGAAILVVFTLVLYLPSFHADFIWDDDALLTDNSAIKAADGLRTIWFSFSQPDYCPLTLTSFWVEWRLWGMSPAGYHGTNIILHALAAVLLWRVLLRLQVPAAWWAALLFVVHPVCVASVTWIAERKNTLSMFFYFLSILLYLRSDSNPRPPSGPRLSTLDSRLYCFSFLAFFLALLSKTSVVMLPFVLLLIAWWERGGITVRDFGRSVPFFAASFGMGVVTLWFHSFCVMPEGAPDTLLVRLLAGTQAFWFYLWKILLPQNLMMIYPRWQINPASLQAWLPGLLCLGAFILFWRFRHTWGRSCLFAFAYFLFALAPVLGIVNTVFFTYSQASDHFQYLAVPGIIALLVGGADHLWQARLAAISLPHRPIAPLSITQHATRLRHPSSFYLLLVLVLSLLTWQHQKIFHNSAALWGDNLLKNPHSWKVHNGLGAALGDQGNYPAAVAEFKAALQIDPHRGNLHFNLALALHRMERREEAIREYLIALKYELVLHRTHYYLGLALFETRRIEEAIFHFKEAIRLLPSGYALAEFNLGGALAQKQKPDEAVCHLQEALRLQPAYPEAHDKLGLLLDQSGQTNEASAHYQAAVRQDPDFALAYFHLAELFSRQGQVDLAQKNYQEALRCAPAFFAAHYGLGLVLLHQQKIPEAIDHWHRALQIKPDSLEVLNNLAWLLATSSDVNSRNGREAVRLAEIAYAAEPKNFSFSDTLAAAYAEVGRFAEAMNAVQRAIALSDGEGQTNAAAKFRVRLELYRQQRPLHEP